MRKKAGIDENFNIAWFRDQVAESSSICVLYSKTKIGGDRLARLIDHFRIDTSHFTKFGKGSVKPDTFIEKICPQCNNTFQTERRKPKLRCSRSCANSYLKKGKNKRNRKHTTGRNATVYTHLCFSRYGKQCIICNEDVAVDVHHIDGNCKNDDIDNLIPLCANHHRYAHIKQYKDFINNKIKEFKANFKAAIV